jgi:thioredoxin reductase (NADPH)
VALRALFVYIGSVAQTSFLGDRLALDANGRVWTDAWMRTELPGLLAAGDVRVESAMQAVSVAGDGATAAVAAHRYLRDGVWQDGVSGENALAAVTPAGGAAV